MPAGANRRIGTELAGYRIEELLGRGGTSVVYRGEHVRLDRKVALKLLAPGLGEDDEFRERFLRESQLAASLDHPNIVPVYEAGEDDGLLYIAMRYVEGSDLRRCSREGPLEPRARVAHRRRRSPARSTPPTRAASSTATSSRPTSSSPTATEHVYLADFGL